MHHCPRRHLEYAGLCPCSETVKTEASPSGRHQKVRMLDVQPSLLFCASGRSKVLGDFSQWHSTVFCGGNMEEEYHKFSYQLWCGWLWTHLQCRSLLTGFWMSHKKKSFMYCCRNRLLHGRKEDLRLPILSSCWHQSPKELIAMRLLLMAGTFYREY